MNVNANALDSLSFDQLVPSDSKYLTKTDVGEDGVILTIAGFTRTTVKGDNGEEDKVVMHFAEHGIKPMILNKTNSQLLAKITGATTAGAAKGKQIVVFEDPSIAFGGELKGGIRIKRIPGPARAPSTPKAAPAPAAREPGSDDGGFGDEPTF